MQRGLTMHQSRQPDGVDKREYPRWQETIDHYENRYEHNDFSNETDMTA
jgi:hypothetical protein